MARGADADLKLALQILDTLDEIADRTFIYTRTRSRSCHCAPWRWRRRGKPGRLREVLKQALDLAQPGGFIRVFVDLGKPMQAMLRRLAIKATRGVIDRILAAFPIPGGMIRMANLAAKAWRRRHSPPLGNSTLAEPLTRRELEVLALLRGPVSIKEIAQKLHISYATAKDHTIKIYAKLGVNRRWDAVARAEELNLLPPAEIFPLQNPIVLHHYYTNCWYNFASYSFIFDS